MIPTRKKTEETKPRAQARGSSIIPDSAKEKPQQGEVVATGKGKRLENGTLVPLDVKVGDRAKDFAPMTMKDEWIKDLSDGRLVQFTCLDLAPDGVFMTAQIARNEVVYSILLSGVNNPLSRKEVESRFESELLKKYIVN